MEDMLTKQLNEQKESFDTNLKNLKEMVNEQVKKAWKEGYSQGAIITCATLYKTFMKHGLDENNILFVILKDIAAANGCNDIKSVINQYSKEEKE